MKEKRTLTQTIVVVGETGVGKTSLLHRYIDARFETDYKKTIGANPMIKFIPFIDEKIDMVITFWDIGGDLQFIATWDVFAESDGIILVYDIADIISFHKLLSF